MAKTTAERDNALAEVIASSLNKEFKGQKVAYIPGQDTDIPTDITGWLSTGSTILDLRISNRPDAGIPIGKITELNGLEGSGKSMLGAHILASVQKQGGIAVYIDIESSVYFDFLKSLGVNLKHNFVYSQCETVEEAFEIIEHITTKIREENPDIPVAILVDSLAAASTKVEMEADYDKDGWATSKAIIISKAMRKITNAIARQKIAVIFTNQLRQQLGVTFGDPWTTSGGKGLPFHASIRIRVKNMGMVKDTKSGEIIGVKINAKVIKNRIGPPMRQANFVLYFDRGIDDYGSWLTLMKEEKLVKSSGAWYQMDGVDKKFQSKDFEQMMINDPELREKCYQQICEACILEYQSTEIGIDDIEETKVGEDELEM